MTDPSGPPWIPGPLQPDTILATDLDGDGKLDLAASNIILAQVVTRRGLGGGAYGPPVTYAMGGWGGGNFTSMVTTTDVNGDGRPDLVSSVGNYGVSVFVNHGDGTLANAVSYPGSPVFDCACALGDVNGDGKPDIVTTDDWSTGHVAVLLNHGDGTFANSIIHNGGYAPSLLALGDLTGDGKLDILFIENGPLRLMRGHGDGTFAPKENVPLSMGAANVAIGDLNADGKLDVVVPNGNGWIQVLLNDGNATFSTLTTYPTPQGPGHIALGDVDGDGKLDIAAAHSSSTGGVSVLRNHGDGTFAAPITYRAGSTMKGLTIADLDGDGAPDIAAVSYTESRIYLLFNDGSGAFCAPVL